MKTKAQAEEAAKSLIKKMNGKGWKLRMWQNIGWHYEIRNGPIAVSPCYPEGKFSCKLSDSLEDSYGGSLIWANNFSSKDPNKAVMHEIKNARKELNLIIDAVRFVENIME